LTEIIVKPDMLLRFTPITKIKNKKTHQLLDGFTT